MSFFDSPKHVLIIAASGGIGYAITKQLLSKNHRLFVTTRDIHSEHASNLLQLIQTHPDQTDLFETNLSQEASIIKLFQDIEKITAQLDVIVNCSGLLHDQMMRPEKRLEDIEQHKLERIFNINSIAPLLIARYALPFLKNSHSNILANISARVGSISDNRIGGWYGYRASKAAQNMATKTIAIELKRRNPNSIVVGLHPGTVDTDLSRPFQSNVKPEQLKTPDEAASNLINVMANLKPEDSGKVFAWDNQEIPA